MLICKMTNLTEGAPHFRIEGDGNSWGFESLKLNIRGVAINGGGLIRGVVRAIKVGHK